MSDTLNVATVGMTSVDDWEANKKWLVNTLGKVSGDVDLVCCPETSLFFRLKEKAPIEARDIDDPIFQDLHSWARDTETVLHLGSVPLKKENSVQNAEVILWPSGERTAAYSKIHLFDVDISGHQSYRESDAFSHGSHPSTFTVKGWKIGTSICYDLRFSELYLAYARLGVDLILIPSAFTAPTGKAHWEILVRARAIETQSYVVAPGQGGDHNGLRKTYGHSLVVDPWGVVLGEVETSGITIQRLEKAKIQAVRQQIPIAQHRRL